MRPFHIWLLLALAWALDSLLALLHRNWLQAGLTAFFALCFLTISQIFRKREQKATRNQLSVSATKKV
jgi:membrane protein implicated in regulation of membrane protease activity